MAAGGAAAMMMMPPSGRPLSSQLLDASSPPPPPPPPGAPGGGPLREVVYENTFIVGPEGHGEGARFQRHRVAAVLRAVLQERVGAKAAYDPVKAAQLAKHVAEDVRARVRGLGYDRYKLVVQVTLGQKRGQATRLVSRCLWDTATDGYASEAVESDTLFCVAQVFALYLE